MQLLVTFDSSHAAMETELLAEEVGLPVRLIPLPPQVRAGCGLALLCEEAHREALCALMARHRLACGVLYTGRPGSWERA